MSGAQPHERGRIQRPDNSRQIERSAYFSIVAPAATTMLKTMSNEILEAEFPRRQKRKNLPVEPSTGRL